jgi:arsenate reductase (thioredoxin)
MTKTVLFLCPHHAAKSVIAAAYFQRLAEQNGLDLRADSAGTEPSPQVSPAVVELLRAEGIDISSQQPHRFTETQLAQASRIISLGCTAPELGLPESRVEHWNDVPPPSQDLVGASESIRRHIERLVNELSVGQP